MIFLSFHEDFFRPWWRKQFPQNTSQCLMVFIHVWSSALSLMRPNAPEYARVRRSIRSFNNPHEHWGNPTQKRPGAITGHQALQNVFQSSKDYFRLITPCTRRKTYAYFFTKNTHQFYHNEVIIPHKLTGEGWRLHRRWFAAICSVRWTVLQKTYKFALSLLCWQLWVVYKTSGGLESNSSWRTQISSLSHASDKKINTFP